MRVIWIDDVSNITWAAEQDAIVYKLMNQYGFSRLEITPTRIFVENPYDKCMEAEKWSKGVEHEYGFASPFGLEERNGYLAIVKNARCFVGYTRKAINFAEVIGCRDLVLGCPRNRNILKDTDLEIEVRFLRKIGDHAAKCGTIIGMETNPPIYNTNFFQ